MIVQAARLAKISPFIVSGLGALAYCTGLMSGLASLLTAAGLGFVVERFRWLWNKITDFVNWIGKGADKVAEAATKINKQLGALIKAAVEAIKNALTALGVSAQSIASSIVLAVLMYVAIKLLT